MVPVLSARVGRRNEIRRLIDYAITDMSQEKYQVTEALELVGIFFAL